MSSRRRWRRWRGYWRADAMSFAETLFEQYCVSNSIPCKKIPTGTTPTSDYEIILNQKPIHVEIKEIEQDQGLELHPGGGWTYSGKPGEIIRRRILAAQKQVKQSALQNIPAILLIYNGVTVPQNYPPTANSDFTHGMYGEMTTYLDIETNTISEPIHGKNRVLQETKNTSFSAVGRLERTPNGASIHVFENAFAKNKLDFDKLPDCVKWNRVAFVPRKS